MKELPIPNQQTDQDQRDQAKGCGSCAFMILGVILPILIGAYGVSELNWDTETAVTITGGVFFVCWLIAIGLAMLIENISWLFSFLPALGSLVYTLVPDFIPGPIDDITVVIVGVFFSIMLVVKKVAPAYILLALVITGLYAWFARNWIEGLADELVVFLVVLVLAFVASSRYGRSPKYSD